MYEFETRKLSFQLVPSTSWYINLRSILPNWAEISSKVRSTTQCDICGQKSNALEAHEVWEYDDVHSLQKLQRVIAVCRDCHQSIHIGYSLVSGKYNEAIAHYIKVNQIPDYVAKVDEEVAFSVWNKRCTHNWKIDKKQITDTILHQLGITCDFGKSTNGRFYAQVYFNEKEEAKIYGAKWDRNRKMWYFPSEVIRSRWNEMKNRE